MMSIIEKAASKISAVPAAREPSFPPVIEPILGELPAPDRSRTRPAFDDPHAEPRGAARAEPPPAVDAALAYQELDFERLKGMGLITPDTERGQVAEEFRLIKRPLIANAFGIGGPKVKDGNLIMVTSSLPGEGKSFCSMNLAISLAMELDRTVLLVDADVARPRVPEYLRIKTDLGLLDLLRDDRLRMSDVLIKTNIPNLAILPAGRTYRRATELLASEHMTRLVAEIGTRYADRIVIFDSPPLLATSESSVLATHMGQIVMVVEAERTTESTVRDALAQLEGCEVIGMLLNKATALPGQSGGYYYYGYYGGQKG
jgi:receptor protein-tyrosine kinase